MYIFTVHTSQTSIGDYIFCCPYTFTTTVWFDTDKHHKLIPLSFNRKLKSMQTKYLSLSIISIAACNRACYHTQCVSQLHTV